MAQKLYVQGNLGRDPEMRYTPKGQAVCNFSVAENRQYTGADVQVVKETTWFNVSAWGKTAENCNQYLKKGQSVTVWGRLTADPATHGPRIWTGQDGTNRASFEVSAAEVIFGSMPTAHANAEAGPAEGAEPVAEEAIDF
jgi:single-strand DNA-binding protein